MEETGGVGGIKWNRSGMRYDKWCAFLISGVESSGTDVE